MSPSQMLTNMFQELVLFFFFPHTGEKNKYEIQLLSSKVHIFMSIIKREMVFWNTPYWVAEEVRALATLVPSLIIVFCGN